MYLCAVEIPFAINAYVNVSPFEAERLLLRMFALIQGYTPIMLRNARA
jgi:hypothetical protein